QRERFRPRGEISRRGECTVHALLSRRYSAIPVSSGAFADGGLQWSAASLLDLWQPGRGQQAERDAGNGGKPSVAGRAGEDYRNEADGRNGDSRLLCAAAEVAG